MKIKKLETNFEVQKLASAVEEGFSKPQKQLSSMFFYDDKGSELFQKITQQEEYYLTNSEYEILNTYSKNIVSQMKSEEIDIIELGVGDGHKSKILIDEFINRGIKVNFYPIDISEKAMNLLTQFISENELLSITGLITDYHTGIKHIHNFSNNKKLVLFLGSNIGNFKKQDSHFMIKEIANNLNSGDFLLTGFDLKKEVSTLEHAYNDNAGITSQFNKNILRRINRELNADFNTDSFEHKGFYNKELGAMESYLVSTKNQTINIKSLKKSVQFRESETIHLEYSFKYSPEDIKGLAQNSNFEVVQNFTDSKKYFVDSLWQLS